MKTTLGYDNKSYAANGDIIYNLDNLNILNSISAAVKGVSKNLLPCVYTYCGKKGTFNGSNICIIDIDTTEYVDKLLNNIDKLFYVVPEILFAQKSYSGKLHIVSLLDYIYHNEYEYKNAVALNTAYILRVIEKLFDINYYIIEGAIDTHSLSWKQKLYISSNKPYINNNVIEQFSSENIEKNKEQLQKYYDRIFIDIRKVEYKKIDIYKTLDGEYTSTDMFNRLSIDKNLCIGNTIEGKELRGHELRWRIVRIANELFGDNAKEWCDARFYKKEGSIYTNLSNVAINAPINSIVLNWLVSSGYLNRNVIVEKRPEYSSIKNNNALEVKTFLSEEYYEYIKETIEKNNVTTLISGTGTGKTKLINELAADYKGAIIATPFNAMRSLYKGNIVDRIENTLFGTERIKSSETIKTIKANEYDPEVSCVMVYDQLAKMDINLLDNKYIFIDECHVLFIDQDFRKRLTELINILKCLKTNCHIVLVSATPLYETELIKSDITLNFFKNRRIINTSILNFSNNATKRTYIETIIQNDVKYRKHYYTNKYDRVVVFSDSLTRKIYHNLLAKNYGNTNCFGILHTEFPEELNEIKETETLTKPVYLCTSVAYNGLNFKNNNEKVLCFVDYTYGKDLAWKIIQAAGRFRNSNVDLVICTSNDITENSIEKKIILNNIKKNVGLRSVQFNSDYLNELYIKVIKTISDYVNDHTMLLKDELIEQGYFNIELEQTFKENELTVNELNKKIDNIVKDLIINDKGTIIDILEKNKKNIQYGNDIYDTIAKEIICSTLPDHIIKEISKIKNTMINTQLKKFCLINAIIDDGTDKIEEGLDILNIALKNETDAWVKSELQTTIKKLMKGCDIVGCMITEERKGLYSIFGGKDKYIQCVKNNAYKKLLEYIKTKDKECSRQKKIGGKNGSPKKKVKVINDKTGVETIFDSKNEAMQFIGCGSKCFAKLIKGEKSMHFAYTVICL